MASKPIAARFSNQPRVVLPGSDKTALQGTSVQQPTTVRQPTTPKPSLAATPSPARPAAKITVSVMVRRKSPLTAANCSGRTRLTRTQYRQGHAADPAAIQIVRAFAKEFGLTLASARPEHCILQLTGTVAAMQKAFGVSLQTQTIEGVSYRVREGAIHLPQELAPYVEAVLGLDNRPQARPHFRVWTGSKIRPRASATNVSYTPVQLAQLYQFPAGATAAGQTIGIIELGGGYRNADLTAYFKSLGQTPPSVSAVSVDQGKNSPSTASGADGEVMLDIEVCAAIAPGAKIVVYFAPNTDQGFIDAISTAIHDTANKPSVISISWGGPESSWTQQAMTALDAACQSAAALGITITVACGDNGASDGGSGNNVDFPASSPHVLACGGTKLIGSGASISSEVVWNELARNEGATGGGVSGVFAQPSWQANANVPAPTQSTGGRGVPDVAGNADPATGYVIRVDGQTLVIGGTSAVAPLWAGLIALNNAANKRSAGLIQPQIYSAKGKAAFRDIVSGDNGGFSAGPGWDACTGLGSPIGTALIQLLSGTVPPAQKKAKAKSAGLVSSSDSKNNTKQFR